MPRRLEGDLEHNAVSAEGLRDGLKTPGQTSPNDRANLVRQPAQKFVVAASSAPLSTPRGSLNTATLIASSKMQAATANSVAAIILCTQSPTWVRQIELGSELSFVR
jgi:hypothetical protein